MWTGAKNISAVTNVDIAITKYHKLSSLYNTIISQSSEAGKYKIKVSAESFPGDRFSSWLADTAFLVCPHMVHVEKRWREGKRER